MGSSGRSSRERAVELVRDAVQRVNLDAIRRFATKRASGPHRLPLCRQCGDEICVGDTVRSRGLCWTCAHPEGLYPKDAA